METTTDYTEKLPGILDLVRIMILIALFGLMICLESSAQVPNKTCCNPLYSLDVEQIRQFLAYLDSIEESKAIQAPENHQDSKFFDQIEKGSSLVSRITAENQSGWIISNQHYSKVKRNLQMKAMLNNSLARKNGFKLKV
jgi:hypothetical protein